ncbi:MAG: hypothetical protein LUQ09_07245 [Methanomassiliicoccales archaeon]|nr:hypothetical protein [Methanomassiliicoccales archaeon]
MEVLGLCSVCSRPASHSCVMCGKALCSRHYDHESRMCQQCSPNPRSLRGHDDPLEKRLMR